MAPGWEQHLNQALMRIPRRAESTDRQTLARTYVSAGSFSAMLNSTDHQILYGRRGTGKTHALLHLLDLVERTGDVAVYLDLRTIGSSGGLYADTSLDPAVRGTRLLVDTLEAVHEELLIVAIEREVTDQSALLRSLDALADAATAVQVVGEVEQESTLTGSTESTSGVELTASMVPAVKAAFTSRQAVAAARRLRRIGIERHHVVFGPLSRALRRIAESIRPARLWLLVDEWSSVPLDLQPLLADLLRRSILPVSGITVKIAAIERRSRFVQSRVSGDYLGIEVGSDAASAVSLDDFLIFDRGHDRAQEFFSELFFNHAGLLLTSMVNNSPPAASNFLQEAFRRNAFTELVRAAEGVPRDAINIAALAAQRAHDEPIGLTHVRQAAKDWYLRDKQAAINTNEAARRTLRFLVDEVVGRRRSRTFLLDQMVGTGHETIEELYDVRLLHVLRRGIVDRRNPGRLYDGFAIDYGCYVGLLLADDPHFHLKDRNTWLKSPKGVPSNDFDLTKAAVDLSRLEP